MILRGVSLQIKLTKDRLCFYMMSKVADSETEFRFLDAQLLVKGVKPDPVMLIDHTSTYKAGALARYNATNVERKTFTFSAVSNYLSIDKADLDPVPKRLIFTMVKNADFIVSMDTNPYKFRHYDISDYSLFVNENSSLTRAYLWSCITKRAP